MKYILHYVNTMNRGGMENFIMNLYQAIDRSKYQFHFAVHTNQEGDWDSKIKELGGEIIHFPKFRDNPRVYYQTWKNFWEHNKNEYSFFHYHTNSLGNINAIKAAYNAGFKNIIIHAHSSYSTKGILQPLHLWAQKINRKWIEKKQFTLVATSKAAADWLYRKKDGIHIIESGIEYSKFEFDSIKRSDIRKKLNLDDKIVVGHVGNFLPVKNHSFIIDIMSALIKQDNRYVALLLGDGKKRGQIQNDVKKLNLEENIIFIGNVPSPEDYLNAMDIFIFPSKYEGLGMAMVEAQINGLEVLSNKLLPREAIISDKVVQLDIQDINQWTEVISANTYKERTSNIINYKYDIDNITKKICDICYEE